MDRTTKSNKTLQFFKNSTKPPTFLKTGSVLRFQLLLFRCINSFPFPWAIRLFNPSFWLHYTLVFGIHFCTQKTTINTESKISKFSVLSKELGALSVSQISCYIYTPNFHSQYYWEMQHQHPNSYMAF